MVRKLMFMWFFLLHLYVLVVDCLLLKDENFVDFKVLKVADELQRETLPLQKGHRLYQLCGLKPSLWYEVKISYPASIPASFSIQLKQDKSNADSNAKRRLLNTEKLIFKADGDLLSGCSDVHVLVNVEPAGVVAIPYARERQYVIYNIVCDELSLVSPRRVWWVVILAFLCLGSALAIPYFLPPLLLPAKQPPRPGNLDSTKRY